MDVDSAIPKLLGSALRQEASTTTSHFHMHTSIVLVNEELFSLRRLFKKWYKFCCTREKSASKSKSNQMMSTLNWRDDDEYLIKQELFRKRSKKKIGNSNNNLFQSTNFKLTCALFVVYRRSTSPTSAFRHSSLTTPISQRSSEKSPSAAAGNSQMQNQSSSSVSFFGIQRNAMNQTILSKTFKLWRKVYVFTSFYIRQLKLKGLNCFMIQASRRLMQKERTASSCSHFEMSSKKRAIKYLLSHVLQAIKFKLRLSNISFRKFNQIRSAAADSPREHSACKNTHMFNQTLYVFKTWRNIALYSRSRSLLIKQLYAKRKRGIFTIIRNAYVEKRIMLFRSRVLFYNWLGILVRNRHIRSKTRYWFLEIYKHHRKTFVKENFVRQIMRNNMKRDVFKSIRSLFKMIRFHSSNRLLCAFQKLKLNKIQSCKVHSNSQLVKTYMVSTHMEKWVAYFSRRRIFATKKTLALSDIFSRSLKSLLIKLKANIFTSTMNRRQFESSQKWHENFTMYKCLTMVKQTIHSKGVSLTRIREALLNNILSNDFKRYLFYKKAKSQIGESLQALTRRMFDVMVHNALVCKCLERLKNCKLRSKRVRLSNAEVYHNYYKMSISFSELFTICRASKLRAAKSARHNLSINFNKIRQLIDVRKDKKQRHNEIISYSNLTTLKSFLDRWKKRVSKCLFARKSVTQGQFYHQFKRKHFALVSLKCGTL